MRTLVYQSFRTRDVPPWVDTCLASVRAWAGTRGYAYRFFDDSFFKHAPGWFRSRVGHRTRPVSDMARLRLAQALLEEGWERTVWVDADVLVFAPALLEVEAPWGYAFVREVWTSVRGGAVVPDERVNNCVSVFSRGNPMLEFYVHACEQAAANRPLSDWHLGTGLLTTLHRVIGLPLLKRVGTASPQLLRELAGGGTEFSAAYMAAVGVPLAAMNLSASSAGHASDEVTSPHAMHADAVAALLETGGGVLNGLLPQAVPGAG